jgi:hypothetical protein
VRIFVFMVLALWNYIWLCSLSCNFYDFLFLGGRNLKRRYHDKQQVYRRLLCKRPKTYLVMLMSC